MRTLPPNVPTLARPTDMDDADARAWHAHLVATYGPADRRPERPFTWVGQASLASPPAVPDVPPRPRLNAVNADAGPSASAKAAGPAAKTTKKKKNDLPAAVKAKVVAAAATGPALPVAGSKRPSSDPVPLPPSKMKRPGVVVEANAVLGDVPPNAVTKPKPKTTVPLPTAEVEVVVPPVPARKKKLMPRAKVRPGQTNSSSAGPSVEVGGSQLAHYVLGCGRNHSDDPNDIMPDYNPAEVSASPPLREVCLLTCFHARVACRRVRRHHQQDRGSSAYPWRPFHHSKVPRRSPVCDAPQGSRHVSERWSRSGVLAELNRRLRWPRRQRHTRW